MVDLCPVERSDFDLLEAWRAGEQRAGEQLFRRHFDALYRFFFNKVGDSTDELVQQTLLGCVEARDQFRRASSFRAYLFGIARNKLYKFVRSKARGKPVETWHSIGEYTSMAEEIGRHQQAALLLQALRALPLELQLLLELSYWEQLSDRELAELLEIPVGTLKSRLRKARIELGECIQSQAKSVELGRTTVENLDAWADYVRGLRASTSEVPDPMRAALQRLGRDRGGEGAT